MRSPSPSNKPSSRRHRSHKVKASKIDQETVSFPSGSHREVTVVEVRYPQTQGAKNRRLYTDYEISVKTNSKAFALHRSSVRRRYSDFLWLKKWLHDHNEGFGKKTPALPPKKYLRRFDDDFIQERMKGLQKFLKRVIEYNVFLSDKALHLFLQSSLSIAQIEDYMHGKPVEGNYGEHSASTPSLSVLNQQPVYATSFSPSLSSSLDEIPEHCERRASLTGTSSEECSSCACSYRSERDFLEFSVNHSQRSSVSEDSNTESDAGLRKEMITIATKVDTEHDTEVSVPERLDDVSHDTENSLASAFDEVDRQIRILVTSPSHENDSGLFLQEEKKASDEDRVSPVSGNTNSDKDSGQESETSSVVDECAVCSLVDRVSLFDLPDETLSSDEDLAKLKDLSDLPESESSIERPSHGEQPLNEDEEKAKTEESAIYCDEE